MNITLKHYAYYFAIALEIDLPIKEEMITWADNLILNSSQPKIWMIDLSTSRKKSVRDTIRILREVEGKSDIHISFRLVIAKLGILYNLIDEKNYSVLSRLGYWYKINKKNC